MTAAILAAVLPGAISATVVTGTELSLSAASGEQSVIGDARSVHPSSIVAHHDRAPASADISVMDQYDPETFTEAAAALPEGLASAIQRDLEISPEQYLAEAEAALDASSVLAGLAAAGIPIRGSEMAGTELIVYLSSVSDRAAVENLGATAVIGKPVTRDYSETTFSAMAFPELRGGEAYSFDGHRCSAGFNGYASSDGVLRMVTAGHCFGSGTYTSLTQDSPSLTGSPSFAVGSAIGTAVPGSFQFGDGYDVGLVEVSEPGWDPRPEVLTWGGGVGAPLASAPLPVYDQAAPIQAAKVCKSGSTTGWTCGEILGTGSVLVAADGQDYVVYGVVTDLCMLPGDSGGPALIGHAAVGINSAGSWSNDCDPAGQEDAESFHFMMEPAPIDQPSVEAKYGPNWELAVTVEQPVVATAGEIAPGGVLSGTLPYGSDLHSVELHVDGSGTAITGTVASDGNWAISLAGIESGIHSYSLKATWGTWSESAAVSGTFTISGATEEPVPTAVPVYRFWSSAYNGHFYTASRTERDYIIANYPTHVWAYESVAYGAFRTQVPGTIPLYRFWSSAYNGHFYTASEAEKNHVIVSYDDFTWKYESIAYFVYPSSLKSTSTKPVARFWGPTYKHHFYTASAGEAAHVKANYPPQIWTYESDPFRVPVAVPKDAPLP